MGRVKVDLIALLVSVAYGAGAAMLGKFFNADVTALIAGAALFYGVRAWVREEIV